MVIKFIYGFIIISTVSFLLAFASMYLTKKIGFYAIRIIYLAILGIISIWRSISQGFSLAYIVLTIIIYLILSVAILFLLSKALEKWLFKPVIVTPVKIREMGARIALEHSPDEPNELFEWFRVESENQGVGMNICNIPMRKLP